MAETATQPGLLGSLQWEPTIERFDTAVGDAIASHCAEAGLPVPPDEAFQSATWLVPVGTDLEGPEWTGYLGRASAPALRVDMDDGRSFALLIGWSDRCGCGSCDGLPSLRVVEVRVAPAASVPPTVGEVLGGAVLGILFVLVIPYLSLFLP